MGRWRWTVFLRTTVNWERLEKDLALLNDQNMIGKSIHTSSGFASWLSDGAGAGCVSVGSHAEFGRCFNLQPGAESAKEHHY